MFDIALIADLQSLLKPIDSVIRWISYHMYAMHYLGISAIIYWAGYQTLAARLSCTVIFSTLIFGGCRQFFASVRPYWVSPDLYNGLIEKGYGMPSGHVQNAVVFWGGLAFSLRDIFVTFIAVAMIVIIAISRMYLGVHFPIQIVWGIILGSSILLLSILFEKKFLRWFCCFVKGKQICIATFFAILPLAMIIILREVFNIGSGNGSAHPYTFMLLFTGMAVGITTGLVITKNIFSKIGLWARVTRVLFGILTLYLLWVGFEHIANYFECKICQYTFSFIRGLFLAWWAIWFWPWTHKLLSMKKDWLG